MNKKSDMPEFMRKQYEFTAHLRDPENNPAPPDVEGRRMAVYRRLFFRNIESFIAKGFPVLRKLYTDADWEQLVRSFFAHHRSGSPHFIDISREFLQYLQDEHQARPCDPPFLQELAHYEWVELALSVSTETADVGGIDPNADLLQGKPTLSPLAWPLGYRWPVQMISPEYRPETPPEQPTYLVVYRDRNDQIRFVSINAVTARLLELLQEQPELTGLEALQQIAKEMKHPNPDVVINGGLQTLEQLKSQGIIPGVKK
ncbi:MAG TPA: putative DNA-binding domain-containing protein [Gammaproteobacteria bacterium]|nr:putative DNA-binding domain-containing protein [Gammaproteobacteria bacterium]